MRSWHAGSGVIVELGRGPGALLASLASARPDLAFVGVDVSERMIDHGRRTHAAPNATLRVEPNRFHPYVFFEQERMKRRSLGEDHVRLGTFVEALPAAGFAIDERRTAFIFPASLRRVPRPLASVERVLERILPLGGSVVFVARAI